MPSCAVPRLRNIITILSFCRYCENNSYPSNTITVVHSKCIIIQTFKWRQTAEMQMIRVKNNSRASYAVIFLLYTAFVFLRTFLWRGFYFYFTMFITCARGRYTISWVQDGVRVYSKSRSKSPTGPENRFLGYCVLRAHASTATAIDRPGLPTCTVSQRQIQGQALTLV